MIRIKNGFRLFEVRKEDSGEYEVYHLNHLSVVDKGNAWLLCQPPKLPLIMIKKEHGYFFDKKKSLI